MIVPSRHLGLTGGRQVMTLTHTEYSLNLDTVRFLRNRVRPRGAGNTLSKQGNVRTNSTRGADLRR